MNHKGYFELIGICLFFAMGTANVCAQNGQYLNQEPPHFTPEIFAPGLISKENESEENDMEKTFLTTDHVST
jgi:hypothetical protein